MYVQNLKFVALGLPVPEIIAFEFLGGGCEPQSWEKEAVGGRGYRTVRKSFGEFL